MIPLLRRDDNIVFKIIEEPAFICEESQLTLGFIFFRQQSRVK
jgi:hypothetical protein